MPTAKWVDIVPVNPEATTIIRLWLDRLPMMNDDERGLAANAIRLMLNPPMLASLPTEP